MNEVINNSMMNNSAAIEKAIQYHQSGCLEKAEEIYSRLLQLNPNHPELLHVLGIISHQLNEHDESVILLNQAIAVSPTNPFFYSSLGDVLKDQGRLNESMACYRKALQLKPEQAEVCFNSAMISHDQGNLEAAISYYLKAVELNPDFVEAYYNAGLAYQTLNKLEDAIIYYQKTLHLKPTHAKAHNNIGKAYKDLHDVHKAVACFQRALELKPDFAEPYFNLGDTLNSMGQIEAAIENYKQALRYRPDMGEAYNNLGNILKNQGNLDAAIENYRQVLRLEPNFAEPYYNLGSTLRLKNKFQEAAAYLKQALKLKPEYAEAYNNLGLTYKNQGELDRSIEHFTRALQIKSQLGEARWNRSFVYLLQGNFKDGWRDYEWRLQQAGWKTLYPFRYHTPRWEGSYCPQKTVFVHDEQGLGDTLQFVRYLPMLKDRCGKVIFETRQSLLGLLRGFPGIDQLVPRPSEAPVAENWDFFIPLLSLPALFSANLETIPNKVPYIHAYPTKVEFWQQRVNGNGFKVGIVWAGRPMHTNDRNRSCRLEQFLPLAEIAGVRLIGLQKGPAASQATELPKDMRVANFGEEFEDFSDTAGLVENLDLVISVDTAVAHLAGAMAKPVWVLLPFIPDWRWMMDRRNSPWYPTMRLFRQKKRGDWESVFQLVAAELQKLPIKNRA
jgi:tetratricopeptide (TPR) repeat protein